MKRSLLCLSAALFAVASSRAVVPAPPSDAVISEDFESVAVGQIPAGFTKTGAIGVAEDVAHSGKHSLKVEPATKGGRFISLSPEKVAALGGEQWGRFYYKVKTPTPLPLIPEGKTTASIHTTLVAGKCTSPLANDPIEVRLAGLSVNGTGAFKYLYNVQPKLRKEFGVGAKTTQNFNDEWTMIEWHADNATQTYQFFLNGQEVTDIGLKKGAGQFEGVEIPAKFDTLSVGWTNYQAATGEGFTVWIDDLAIGKKRLGPAAAAATARK
ncbi:MAG: hypothetical protein ABJF10_24445 [Chthoniobacter sp.]|uniref:hypothetical protein n=1 Tax=Chthoniobacter sp. TaxID=2510640 RepID=UPI0032A65BD8